MFVSCTKAHSSNGEWTLPGKYTQGSRAINNPRFVAGQLQLMQVGGPGEALQLLTARGRPVNERRGANRTNVRHPILRENNLRSGRILESLLFTLTAGMGLPSG